MSDASAGDSGELPKKKSFSSRMKLHNPFKKHNSGSSSDSDDDKRKSPRRTRKTKTSLLPSMPNNFSLSPTKMRDASSPVKEALLRGEAIQAKVSPSTIPDQPPSASAVAPLQDKAAPVATAAPVTAPAISTRPPIKVPEGVSSPVPSKAGASTAGVAAPDAKHAPGGVAAGGTAPEVVRETVTGPVFGSPEIVLSGLKGDADSVMKTLRARGFVVHLAMAHDETVPPTTTMVLGMGPKLLVKSAVERDMAAKAREEYSSAEVSQLCTDAIHIIKRSGVEYDEVTLLHDKEALERVAKSSHKEIPDAVNSYFGPYIGMYFAWLNFYTRALVVPTVGGLVLFVDQWRAGSPDSPLLPIFCVLIMVWAAMFLDLWRRRNSEVSFRWGVDGAEDDELGRVAAKQRGEFLPTPAGKVCVTVPIIFAAVYIVIRTMLYSIWLSDHATEVYGADSYMQYYPLLLYSMVPIVASSLFDFLAVALNEFEDHPTPVRKKNALVVKMFAFHFVNSYCALLYVGFWLRDLGRLRQLMMMMMVVKQFVSQLKEKYEPSVKRWIKDRKEKKTPAKDPRFLVRHTGTISPEDLREELKAEPAAVEDDFLEMVVQFGYISMFAVAFPLAPLFAFANNIWEFKLDLNLLVKTRRPQTHVESSIGAWQLCLEMVGVVACLTNLLFAVLVSENVSPLVPKSMTEQLGTFEGKVVMVVVAEHALLLLRTVLSGLIDKVPRVVREAQAVMAVQRRTERKELRKLARGLPASERSIGGTAINDSPQGRLRQLNETHGVWNFGPMWYLPLAFLPFVVAWFGLSALLVLPIAFVMVSYLQHQKDLAGKALALGIVKDPKVLKLVTQFLPPWYTDSEVERVNWMNKVLDKMWVNASLATDDLFDTTIQPILDSYRPAGVSALGFRRVSLGTIPPKIVGVRALEMKGDKVVIDIDLRWAANAEFVLEAGVKPVPLLVTLNKICFSGKLRVELAPLVPVFPCFGAIALTFMEKPFIDFQFSLGKLDVMSIGPGDMNVGSLVSDMIKNIVTSLMVFPVKLMVPILDDQDLLGLANPTPTGVVQLTVVGCDNLRSADFNGKSDPYVKVKLGLDQEVKTDYINGTLNPRFNATFDLLVYERSVEVMEFSVFDRDAGPGDDDDLGECELPLSVLKPDEERYFNIPLSKTKRGSLLLKATFIPLFSGSKRTAQPDDDVLVSSVGDVITDETVASDVYPSASADTQAALNARGGTESAAKGKAVDPSTLKPELVLNASDTSMGVLSVMGIECKGVKPGERYVSVICGNTKRKTAVVKKMANFACPEVFHYLVKGANSAIVEVLLKEEESIGNDKVLGSFKVRVAEVIANDDQLDGEWDLTGDKAKGTIKMRLKWSGRVSEEATSSS